MWNINIRKKKKNQIDKNVANESIVIYWILSKLLQPCIK